MTFRFSSGPVSTGFAARLRRRRAAGAEKSGRPWRGLVVRLALYLVLLFGVIYMIQDRLLYFPETATPADTVTEARRHGLTPWPDPAGYRALLAEPSAPARATVVVLHGNGGLATDRHWYAEELTRHGLRVLLAEYPGYGPRPGQPGEAVLVADAVETFKLARAAFPGPLLVAGESLGAGVAAAATARLPQAVDGLLLITPFDTLLNAARHHYPWAPVGWLLKDRYDSVGNLANFGGRLAVVIGERDQVVPPRLGEALFAAARAPKKRWTVPAADHYDWMLRVDDPWWREVLDFLLPAAGGPAPEGTRSPEYSGPPRVSPTPTGSAAADGGERR